MVKAIKENPGVGDQETLHAMLGNDLTRRIFINEIPNEYNWLRVQLVNDNQKDRDKIVNYLRSLKNVDDIDIIIALGMAKEGFDWPYCEHALTVGYRGSLTEIIQIIHKMKNYWLNGKI